MYCMYVFCHYFVLTENLFCTFRELGTSIFTWNNIKKRKHSIAKLGFISYDYDITNKGIFVNFFHNLKSEWSLAPGPFCF